MGADARPALRRLRLALGPALLLGLVVFAGPRALWQALSRLGGIAFLLANVGWWTIALVKSWRWRQVLAAQHIAVSPADGARWYLAGLALGSLSPGRIGELAKVVFVRERGAATVPAVVATVYDRLLDVLLLPVVATAALFAHGAADPDDLRLFGLASVLALGGGAGLLLLRRWLAVPVRLLAPKAAGAAVDEVLASLDALPWTLHLRLGLVTVACWVLYAASLVLLARDLALPAPPLVVGAAVLAAALASALPVSFSGVGTRDAVLAALLAPFGVSTGQALALSSATLALLLVQALSFWPAWRSAVRRDPAVGDTLADRG